MAPKKIKVILKERVINIWKPWDIIETSRAYAMNALIPQWKATLLTDKELKKIEQDLKKARLNNVELIEKRHNIAETLHTKEIIFERKWNNKKVFGWISEKDIIDKIKKVFNIELTKSHIKLPDNHHIKTLWKHDVNIHIHDDTYIKIIINLKAI